MNRIKRSLNVLSLTLVALISWSYVYVDALTFCVSPDFTATIINPKVSGVARERTVRHEQVHVYQVKRYGCLNVILMRLDGDKRAELEWEAMSAE